METAENKETKGLDKKKIAIIAGAAVIVVAAVVLVIVNMVKPKDSVKSTTMRLLRAIGEVSLIDNGETKTIMEDMRLADGNVVTTGDKSLASIGLDDYKIVNLEENSSAEFHQDGKKLELTLIEGRLFFDIRKALDETESLDIKASNMIVGIRGTSGYFICDKDNPQKQQVIITDGHVKIKITDKSTGEVKEVDVQSGQKLVLEKDENGNVTDYKVEQAPPEEWDAALAAEVANNTETFERILEATGFDKEVIIEKANGDSTVSYILELQDMDETTPGVTPEATEAPTPEPTEPPEPTVKLVEADGDGTVPPPADGNGNGNGNGQLGAGDGTTNEVTPTPSPVAPVEENPPTEDNSGDSGSGGSSDGSTPTPTGEPTGEPTAEPSSEPGVTEAALPSPSPTVYNVTSDGATVNMQWDTDSSTEYTFYPDSDAEEQKPFTVQLQQYQETGSDGASPTYMLKVTITFEEEFGPEYANDVKLYYGQSDGFVLNEYAENFAVQMQMVDDNGKVFTAALNASTVNMNNYSTCTVYLKPNYPW